MRDMPTKSLTPSCRKRSAVSGCLMVLTAIMGTFTAALMVLARFFLQPSGL